MSNDEMPHEGHDQHLCALHGEGLLKDNFEEWEKIGFQGPICLWRMWKSCKQL